MPAASQGSFRLRRSARRRAAREIRAVSCSHSRLPTAPPSPADASLLAWMCSVDRARQRVSVQRHDRVGQVSALPGLDVAGCLEARRHPHVGARRERLAGEQRGRRLLELFVNAPRRRPRNAPRPVPRGRSGTSSASRPPRRLRPRRPSGSRAIGKPTGTDSRNRVMASLSCSSVRPTTASPSERCRDSRPSRNGKLARHGMHQDAQKSSTTTLPRTVAMGNAAPSVVWNFTLSSRGLDDVAASPARVGAADNIQTATAMATTYPRACAGFRDSVRFLMRRFSLRLANARPAYLLRDEIREAPSCRRSSTRHPSTRINRLTSTGVESSPS